MIDKLLADLGIDRLPRILRHEVWSCAPRTTDPLAISESVITEHCLDIFEADDTEDGWRAARAKAGSLVAGIRSGAVVIHASPGAMVAAAVLLTYDGDNEVGCEFVEAAP